MDEFRAGVTASLRSWSAFRTAVESGWGGGESLKKADDLRAILFQHFDGSSVPPRTMADVMDLEDALAIYMEEEFSIVLEDGSERQLADVIWKMYDNCSKGDLTLALQVRAVAEDAAAKSSAYPVKVVQSPEEDDDDEDDAGEAMDTSETATKTVVQAGIDLATSAAEYASQPLFGPHRQAKSIPNAPPPRQLGEASMIQEAETLVQLDDDGFAPVVKTKRKAKKPV